MAIIVIPEATKNSSFFLKKGYLKNKKEELTAPFLLLTTSK